MQGAESEKKNLESLVVEIMQFGEETETKEKAL